MLKTIPDFRCCRKKKHDQTEVMACFIIGTLVGKKSLRRIRLWCEGQINNLRKYMPLKAGIASVPTFSRMLSGIDEELLSLTFTAWMEEILVLDNAHICIDGKGLRGAARKVMDEKTTYILNAMDAGSGLVIGQMAISDKSNEMNAIPEFLEILDVKGSLVTIDAVGTTGRIMNTIRARGAHFMLQVKKNNPELYDEIIRQFRELKEEKESDPEQFTRKHGSCCYCSGSEKNRERYEYRESWSCSDKEIIMNFRELRPHINSIGQIRQVRIKKIRNREGKEITPTLKEFLKSGSCKQLKPEESDEADSPVQKIGIISDLIMDAQQMMYYKRSHWGIENKLHYILDEVFGEDKSTMRKGKVNASLLRKVAYNIVRFRMLEKGKHGTGKRDSFVHTVDELADDWEVIAKYIFKPVPSF